MSFLTPRGVRQGPFVRVVPGYVDMGSQTIPRFPVYIIMTDRTDGSLWALTYSEDGEKFAITDDIPSSKRFQQQVYGPYAGPYIGDNPLLKLFVRERHLGYEVVDEARPVISQRSIFGRRLFEPLVREIVMPSDEWHPNQGIAHKDVDI